MRHSCSESNGHTELPLSISDQRKLLLCICQMPMQEGYEKFGFPMLCAHDRPPYKQKATGNLKKVLEISDWALL